MFENKNILFNILKIEMAKSNLEHRSLKLIRTVYTISMCSFV